MVAFAIERESLRRIGSDDGPGFIAVGDGWFNTIDAAEAIEGTLPDPAADDEAIIDVAATKLSAYWVGLPRRVRVLTRRILSKDQSRSVFPKECRRTSTGRPPRSSDEAAHRRDPPPTDGFRRVFATGGLLVTGPGWAAAHLDESAHHFTNALVRLTERRRGCAGVQSRRLAALRP